MTSCWCYCPVLRSFTTFQKRISLMLLFAFLSHFKSTWNTDVYMIKMHETHCMCDDNMPSKFISCEVQWNAVHNDDDSLDSLYFQSEQYLQSFVIFGARQVTSSAFYPHLVSPFIIFMYFFFFLSDWTMITIRNEDKRCEFICICIWFGLCFHIIIFCL